MRPLFVAHMQMNNAGAGLTPERRLDGQLFGGEGDGGMVALAPPCTARRDGENGFCSSLFDCSSAIASPFDLVQSSVPNPKFASFKRPGPERTSGSKGH